MPSIRLDLEVNDQGTVKIKQFARTAEKGIGKATKSTERFHGALSSVRTMALSIGAAFGAWKLYDLGRQAIVVGANFEQSMLTTRGVMRATQQEFENLTAIAKRMGATTEWTASQAADALKFLGMAGFDAGKAMKALPGTLDLATAGNIDLGRAADIATNALTAMQLPVEELTRVNDVFVGTITRSNTNMELMAESFKYAAPIGRAFGYELEEIAAMIGKLGSAGVQGSMAGTQLAFAFQQTEKAFKELGVDGTGKDLIDALELINEQGWSAQKVMSVFGVRAGRAANVLMGLVGETREFTDVLKKAQGEANELAEIMRSSIGNQFNVLKSTIQDVAIETFEEYKDSLNSTIKETTEWFRDHKDEIVAVAVEVKNWGTTAAPILWDMVKVFGALAAATLAWNVALRANPWVLGAMGAIALVSYLKQGREEMELMAEASAKMGAPQNAMGGNVQPGKMPLMSAHGNEPQGSPEFLAALRAEQAGLTEVLPGHSDGNIAGITPESTEQLKTLTAEQLATLADANSKYNELELDKLAFREDIFAQMEGEAERYSQLELDKFTYKQELAQQEIDLEIEKAEQLGQIWWNSAQQYIGFAQQMSNMAVQYMLAEGKDKDKIGRQMLATTIRFLTQQVQAYFFAKAQEKIFSASSAAAQIAGATTVAEANMAIGAAQATAWAAYYAAHAANPVGAAIYGASAAAMSAAVGAFGAAGKTSLGVGKIGIGAALGQAAMYAGAGVLVGAIGEGLASHIEGSVTDEDGRHSYATGGSASGEGGIPNYITQPQAQEPRSVNVNVTLDGNGYIQDRQLFARELAEDLRQAYQDNA